MDAGRFDPATAYAAINRMRLDDMRPHVYRTHDYGQTFKSISNDLPAYGNLQVIREDPKNKDLLYVGTEFGLYVSLDGGKTFAPSRGIIETGPPTYPSGSGFPQVGVDQKTGQVKQLAATIILLDDLLAASRADLKPQSI